MHVCSSPRRRYIKVRKWYHKLFFFESEAFDVSWFIIILGLGWLCVGIGFVLVRYSTMFSPHS